MYLRVPLYKYKFAKSISISISFVTPTGDLNKHKSVISTSMCISLLYEFMKILIYCYLLTINVYMHKTYVSH